MNLGITFGKYLTWDMSALVKNAAVSSSNCPTAPADPFRNFHMSWPGPSQRVGPLACPIVLYSLEKGDRQDGGRQIRQSVGGQVIVEDNAEASVGQGREKRG